MGDDDDDDDGPGYGCSDPSGYASLTFSTDGRTATGYAEADISDYDYGNGCFAVVEGQLSENGNVQQDNQTTRYNTEADLTQQTSVEVGSATLSLCMPAPATTTVIAP